MLEGEYWGGPEGVDEAEAADTVAEEGLWLGDDGEDALNEATSVEDGVSDREDDPDDEPAGDTEADCECEELEEGLAAD